MSFCLTDIVCFLFSGHFRISGCFFLWYSGTRHLLSTMALIGIMLFVTVHGSHQCQVHSDSYRTSFLILMIYPSGLFKEKHIFLENNVVRCKKLTSFPVYLWDSIGAINCVKSPFKSSNTVFCAGLTWTMILLVKSQITFHCSSAKKPKGKAEQSPTGKILGVIAYLSHMRRGTSKLCTATPMCHPFQWEVIMLRN